MACVWLQGIMSPCTPLCRRVCLQISNVSRVSQRLHENKMLAVSLDECVG